MNVYIKHIDNGSDSLTHFGVKGMKWRKRKAKALDIAWEIAHPLKGATHETQIDDEMVRRKESRRSVTTQTYRRENGKWKLNTSQTIKKNIKKKPQKKHTTAGKAALNKIAAKTKVKRKAHDLKNDVRLMRYGNEKQRGFVRGNGYRGKVLKRKNRARGKVTEGYKGFY